jgi:hypothetical protein
MHYFVLLQFSLEHLLGLRFLLQHSLGALVVEVRVTDVDCAFHQGAVERLLELLEVLEEELVYLAHYFPLLGVQGLLTTHFIIQQQSN